MTQQTDTRLDEYDKDEWREILKEAVRSAGGSWDEKKFEDGWVEFCELKRRKQFQ